MNHEKTIKRIQELVPSIMALEFGCEVRSLKDVQGIGAIVLNGDAGKYIGYDNFLFEHAQMFGVSGAGFEWERGFKHQYVSLKNYKILKSEFEILGKPITLAVVLRAVEKFTGSSDNVLYVNSVGLMYIINSNKTQKDFIKQFENCVEWNLSKDNFNDQSEATKSFIGELLS